MVFEMLVFDTKVQLITILLMLSMNTEHQDFDFWYQYQLFCKYIDYDIIFIKECCDL